MYTWEWQIGSTLAADDWHILRCSQAWKPACVWCILYHLSCHIFTLIYSWLYRIRPAVAHQGFTPLPLNPDVGHQLPSQHFWVLTTSARIQFPNPQSESSCQPYPTCLAPFWYSRGANWFRGRTQDTSGKWRTHLTRRHRHSYLCREYLDE